MRLQSAAGALALTASLGAVQVGVDALKSQASSATEATNTSPEVQSTRTEIARLCDDSLSSSEECNNLEKIKAFLIAAGISDTAIISAQSAPNEPIPRDWLRKILIFLGFGVLLSIDLSILIFSGSVDAYKETLTWRTLIPGLHFMFAAIPASGLQALDTSTLYLLAMLGFAYLTDEAGDFGVIDRFKDLTPTRVSDLAEKLGMPIKKLIRLIGGGTAILAAGVSVDAGASSPAMLAQANELGINPLIAMAVMAVGVFICNEVAIKLSDFTTAIFKKISEENVEKFAAGLATGAFSLFLLNTIKEYFAQKGFEVPSGFLNSLATGGLAGILASIAFIRAEKTEEA